MDIVHEIPTGTRPSPTACMPSALRQRSSLPSRVLARGRFSRRLFWSGVKFAWNEQNEQKVTSFVLLLEVDNEVYVQHNTLVYIYMNI